MRQPPKSIKLCRGDTEWEVAVDGEVVSCSKDLQWAAFDALLLAEIYETSRVEVGEGVPLDAIEQGLQAHAAWDSPGA
jgi:hypothetical protein